MHSLTTRRPSRMRALSVWMGAALLSVLASGCATLDSGYHWLKGDFRVEISGVPKDASVVYLILGENELLTKAGESEAGYPQLIEQDIDKHLETYNFVQDGDPARWTFNDSILKDAERPLIEILKTKDGSLLLSVHRDKFEKTEENAIAVLVRYNTDLDWQGVTISMEDFQSKEEAEVTISNEGAKLSLFESYRKRQ